MPSDIASRVAVVTGASRGIARAEVVAFLAGPARWVNGQVVRVNGGSSDRQQTAA
jgi:NAD(P)-dependent dehydrogenase (short-subunit alcohol dehydrogenase family)